MQSTEPDENNLIAKTGPAKYQKSALIAGGGIGGLAAGIALQQTGWKVTIYEQAAEIKAIGAGLTLWSNAVKALYRLGMQPELAEMGLPALAGGFFTPKGQLLAGISYAELLEKYGAPSLAVHRADLLEALLKKLEPGSLRLGARLLDFSQESAGVSATFSNGETVQAGLLVGADGIHSRVREKLFGPYPLRYAGYTAWRGVAPAPVASQPFPAGETWGKGQRFGLVPLSRQRVYWFATANRPEKETDNPASRQAELEELFGGWHFPISELIETTPAGTILRNDIYDLPPLNKWTAGRVTLLGDAAHPMTPNLGQGACQAIEDALVLAGCLAKVAEVPVALREYERLRLRRTASIVKKSRQVGTVGQWSNPLLGWLRQGLTRWLLPKLQARQLDPILGYEIERALETVPER
jgi:2-polyprenyl-6-methoxyphenol hydroxylase-like FAD-dependent oxidoreductase